MEKSASEGKRKFLAILKPRRKTVVAAFVLVFVGVLFLAAPAFAQLGILTESGVVSALLSFFGRIILSITSTLLGVTVFLMKFLIAIASYGNYINSGPVNFGWTLVRDVANMFFVIILLVIAFATVLGVENYSWKKLLVKFVLAAVLVNFSRIICGVILDAAQVFMMTFINGVAATAGGNLVNALKLDQVLSFSNSTVPEEFGTGENTGFPVLVAAIAGCIFVCIATAVIGAYVVILLARVITLWILIILSPLAFVLNVIPRTASYANQWWQEFGNNAISGPLLAFFLWLAFAVAGGGNIKTEFDSSVYPLNADAIKEETGAIKEDMNIGLNQVMEWGNLASFLIAIGLLLAGVKATQKLGVAGAGALGAAVDFGKKVATIATGYTAGRWMAGQLKGAAGKRLEMAKLGMQAWGYKQMDSYNRWIEHRSKAGGKEGGVGWLQRRLMLGTTETSLESLKKFAESRKKLFSTSVGEPETMKQAMMDTEVELEKGKGIKEGVIAERRLKAWRKADMKEIPIEGRLLGGGATRTFGEISAAGLAKARLIKEELEAREKGEVATEAERMAVEKPEYLRRATQAKARAGITEAEAKERETIELGREKERLFEAGAEEELQRRETARGVIEERTKERRGLRAAGLKEDLQPDIEDTLLDLQARRAAIEGVAKERRAFKTGALGETYDRAGELEEWRMRRASIEEARKGRTAGIKEELLETPEGENYLRRAAEARELEQDARRAEEIKVAESVDARRASQGLEPVHVEAVRQRHEKEDGEKIYSALPFERVMTLLANERRRLDDYNARIDNPATPAAERNTLLEQRGNLQRDYNRMQSVAYARDASTGPDALLKTIVAAGEVRADVNDSAANLSQVLSGLLNEHVEASYDGVHGIEQAWRRLSQIHGDNFNAFTTQIANSLKQSSNTGAIGLAGLMTINDSGIGYRFTDTRRTDDAQFAHGEREYARSSSRRQPKNLKFAVNRTVNERGEVKLLVDTDDARDSLATMMPTTQLQASNMSQWMIRQFGQILENTLDSTGGKTHVEALIKQMRERGVKDDALGVLLKRISDPALRTRLAPLFTPPRRP